MFHVDPSFEGSWNFPQLICQLSGDYGPCPPDRCRLAVSSTSCDGVIMFRDCRLWDCSWVMLGQPGHLRNFPAFLRLLVSTFFCFFAVFVSSSAFLLFCSLALFFHLFFSFLIICLLSLCGLLPVLLFFYVFVCSCDAYLGISLLPLLLSLSLLGCFLQLLTAALLALLLVLFLCFWNLPEAQTTLNISQTFSKHTPLNINKHQQQININER